MLRSLFRSTVLAGALALSVLPFSPAKAANPDVYGAIAYSPASGAYGSETAYSRASAEYGALHNCQQSTSATDCKVLLWFKNAWGALAVSSNGAYGTGWGYDTQNPGRGRYFADRYAIQTCQQYGGTNCHVILERQARSVRID